ncbi:MAG: FAD-dependent monooxygenase [Silicimonas sp.]|nr:FAD-dependent monooxygenase [Silicimonas sp.]
MSDRYDVLINGGGPVGIGLALELGQRGIRTCVIEKSTEPGPIPKGQNLTQRTCEHFRAWGCEDRVRAAHDIPKGGGIGGMTTYGTLLSDYHYDWLNRAHVNAYYFAANARLPQYATERALRARAAELDCVDTLYGWEGTALAQDDSGVTLTIRDRDTGEARDLRAAYLAGCDGSRSFTREAAGITETRAEHNRLMALVLFTSTELHELLQRYPGKAFYNVLHPDFEGYWQFFGRVDHGRTWFFHAPVPFGTRPENFDFSALLNSAVGQPFAHRIDHIGLWDLRMSLADSYRQGRVFIAGDAAHSHPPYGGFGVNIGFEDARNLGWKLAATLQGWGGPELLDSYEAERRPLFRSTSDDFIERYITDDRAFLETHDPAQDRAAFEAAWSTRNLDADDVLAFEPNYEGSPVIGGEGTPSARGSHSFKARPGHLLPPPGPGNDPAVLAALGTGYAVLGDETLRAEYQAVARTLGIRLTTAPLESAWRDAYQTDALLLRPDRFIAWTAGQSGTPDDVLRCAAGFPKGTP